MITKIILINDCPFSKRIYDFFDIEFFVNNGFEVELWDLSAVFSVEKINKVVDDPFLESRYYSFLNKENVQFRIRGLESNCFIFLLSEYRIKTFFIYQEISQKRIPYGILLNPASAEYIPGVFNLILYKVGRRRTWKGFMNRLFTTLLPWHFFKILPASLCCIDGRLSSKDTLRFYRFPINHSSKILKLHTTDYNYFLRRNHTNLCVVSEPTIVFLDTNLFAEDALSISGKHPILASEYYPMLCKFFDEIEKKYNNRIVIAAHPTSSHEKLLRYFCGREIIKWKTGELVRTSSAVICDGSFSVHFAVLYQKPIIFIIMDRFPLLLRNHITNLSFRLGGTPINLNGYPFTFDERDIFKINKEKYQKYQELFLQTGENNSISNDQAMMTAIQKL